MNYWNKQQQFIDWLCGIKGTKFPFFRNLQPIKEKVIIPKCSTTVCDAEGYVRMEDTGWLCREHLGKLSGDEDDRTPDE